MNLLGTSAIGVDISDGTLKAVHLVRRGRGVVLKRAWRVEATDLELGLGPALGQLAPQLRGQVLPHIVVSAPDRGHFSSTYLIPSMESERLSEMVRYEALSELGVPAEDVLVRHHVRRGVVEQRAHTFALRRDEVERQQALLQQARVPYDDFGLPGFALASFVEFEMPSGRDRLILAVGDLASHLVLLTEDGIWTRHLATGLQHADKLTLAQVLHQEVEAAVAACMPAGRSFRPVDVVLTEEGARSASLTSELGNALDLPVTRMTELQRIRIGRGVQLGPSVVLSMARAFGLALGGLGLARFHCPILEVPEAREAQRRLPLLAATLVLGAAGLLGVTQVVTAREAALEGALVADLPAELAALAERAATERTELSALRGRADALASLARRRPAVFTVRRALAAMSELASEEPEAVLHVDGLSLAPGAPGRPGLLSLNIEGRTRGDEMGSRIAAALSVHFPEVTVSDARPAPRRDRSLWTAEVELP